MKELIKSMLEAKTIELRGFGTFEIKKRKGRAKARNPKTGEVVSNEDHGVAVFRPGKELKVKAWKALTL
jgi:nucleoid DNA-binding protein